MHAGTPSAEGAHALLCVALACVMSARTFRDALARDARDATPVSYTHLTLPTKA